MENSMLHFCRATMTSEEELLTKTQTANFFQFIWGKKTKIIKTIGNFHKLSIRKWFTKKSIFVRPFL